MIDEATRMTMTTTSLIDHMVTDHGQRKFGQRKVLIWFVSRQFRF
jgi:hypothetical protein